MRNPPFSGFTSAGHKSMSARDGVLPVRASRPEDEIFPWERRREASCAEAASGAGRLRRNGKEFLETVSTLNPPKSWKSYPATLPWQQRPSGQSSMCPNIHPCGLRVCAHSSVRPFMRPLIRLCVHPFGHSCIRSCMRVRIRSCLRASVRASFSSSDIAVTRGGPS